MNCYSNANAVLRKPSNVVKRNANIPNAAIFGFVKLYLALFDFIRLYLTSASGTYVHPSHK